MNSSDFYLANHKRIRDPSSDSYSSSDGSEESTSEKVESIRAKKFLRLSGTESADESDDLTSIKELKKPIQTLGSGRYDNLRRSAHSETNEIESL